MSMQAQGLMYGAHAKRRAPAAAGWAARALNRLVRSRNTAFVASVRAAQQSLRGVTGAAWEAHAAQLRAHLARDGVQGEWRIQALASMAVMCERVLKVAPFDTQIIAARLMLEGRLVEMATGEGKTLAAALTAGVAALAGTPVHVLTANDYLVRRDHDALAPLYRALGLSTGAVVTSMDQAARRAAYASDITYCTAKELVFDYLRDGLMGSRHDRLEQQSAAALAGLAGGNEALPRPLVRGLHMAIIDEADSLLIDEARVPLIVSRPVASANQACLLEAWRLSQGLHAGDAFSVDAASRAVHLTAAGRAALQARAMDESRDTPWLNRTHREDLVTLALTARHLLQAGRDYVVEDGRVHIVDETTGRKAEGRVWSNGLQQLVELSAGCAPSPSLETAARITYQRFFPRYRRLCGMSGTLREARGELAAVYGVNVVRAPLRLPSRRMRLPTRVFASAGTQWLAVSARVRELRAAGRPVLIGTDSVRASQALSRCLAAHDVPHVVLNALQDRHEAEVVARAGAAGAVTVATNMAGRGTDIVLDQASRAAGGLHVICCQQNSARRIDRQLMGRCARQGEPGSHEFFVALDGPLLASGWLSILVKNMFKNNWLCLFYGGALGVDAALTWSQMRREREHRRVRAALLRHDERLNDSLAFSGTGE